MKRVVFVWFALLLLVLLVACGGNSNSSSNTTNSTPTPGTSQTGNGGTGGSGGTGATTASAAPSQTTFIYGTSGESVGGARLNSNGQITALNMPTDAMSGAIGWLPGTGGLIGSIAVDPKGRFLYALSLQTASFGNPIGNNGLSAFTIDRSSGALTAVAGSPYSVAKRGGEIVVSGDGKKLLLASNTVITVYAVDQSTGALTKLKDNPGLTDQIRASWDGQYAYAEAVNGPVASYKIGDDGTLTELSRVEVQNRGQFVLSYSGKFLYASGNDGVSVLSIGSNGMLTITQMNFPGFRAVATTRDDRFAYLATADSNTNASRIHAFSMDSTTGAIGSAIGTPLIGPAATFPWQIVTDFSGRFLLTAMSNGLFSYTINSDGSLSSPQQTQGNFISPQEIELAP